MGRSFAATDGQEIRGDHWPDGQELRGDRRHDGPELLTADRWPDGQELRGDRRHDGPELLTADRWPDGPSDVEAETALTYMTRTRRARLLEATATPSPLSCATRERSSCKGIQTIRVAQRHAKILEKLGAKREPPARLLALHEATAPPSPLSRATRNW